MWDGVGVVEAGKQGLLCVARCVSVREGAARHSTPPASPAPAEEEDLITLGASGVSGFLSSQISPSPRPPGLAPPASGRKWAGPGISVNCPHQSAG